MAAAASSESIIKEIAQKVPYDNYEETNSEISKLDICDEKKGLFHKLNMVCSLLEKEYFGKKQHVSWVDNSKISKTVYVQKILKLSYDSELNRFSKNSDLLFHELYFNLLSIKKKFSIMKKALDYIFSPKCKDAKIHSHPNYTKGRDYCLAAIAISSNMISELINELLKSGVITDKIMKLFDQCGETETIKYIETAYPFFDSASLELKNDTQKGLNKTIHYIILNILSPSNFYYLFYNFYHFNHTYNIWLYMYKKVKEYDID